MELATKFGVKFSDGKGSVHGDPAYVRAACEGSLKRLDMDCIDLYYQHRIDTKVPIEITVCLFAPCSLSLCNEILIFAFYKFHVFNNLLKFWSSV